MAIKADVEVISYHDFLCDDTTYKTEIDGKFLYRDSGNLSYEGSEIISRKARLAERLIRDARYSIFDKWVQINLENSALLFRRSKLLVNMPENCAGMRMLAVAPVARPAAVFRGKTVGTGALPKPANAREPDSAETEQIGLVAKLSVGLMHMSSAISNESTISPRSRRARSLRRRTTPGRRRMPWPKGEGAPER